MGNIDQELIDQYLLGNLSGNEVQNFENLLNSDAALAQEVSSQKELIEAVQDQRKAELKGRLASIPVSTGLSTLQKVGIVSAISFVAIGLGFFSYEILNTEESVNSTIVIENSEETNLNQLQEEGNDLAINEEVEVEDEILVESEQEIRDLELESHNSDDDETPVAKTDVGDVDNKEIRTTPDERTLPDPLSKVFTKNQGINDESLIDYDNSTSPDLGTQNQTRIEKAKHSPIKTESGYGFNYRYDGEELVLIGNKFKNKAHENPFVLLLDKNSEQLYLVFESVYYKIDDTDGEKEKLEAFDDPKIIEQLKKAE